MNRLEELAERAYQKNIYCFTDFLSMEEASGVYAVAPESDVTVWNGEEMCERVMVRFGNPDNMGYEQEFPIRMLRIEPLIKKFADTLTHRDFLGAIMNLGVERSVIGDIRVEDKEAFVFVVERMAEYIADGLSRVKHTSVKCSVLSIDDIEGLMPPVKLRDERFTTSSERCDSIVAKAYHMSRKQTLMMFTEHKIFVQGKLYENNSGLLKAGDIVSVRGYGKFVYRGVQYQTKKDKLCVEVAKYT